MAYISSSDESNTPPREFHLSSLSLSEGRMSPVKYKCPLCRKLSEVFYCRQCITSGSYQSTSQPADGFEKQLALLEIRKNIEQLKAHLEHLHKPLLKSYELSSNIVQTKQDIETVKLALKEKENKKEINGERLSALRKFNDDWRGKLRLYDKKVEEIENYISAHKEEVDGRRRKIEEEQKRLKKIVRFSIQEFFRVIFPITVIEPKVDDLSLPLDAAHTTVISDYWEYSDYFSEKKYWIAGPTLPASGNYSAYSAWVSKNRDVARPKSVQSVELNPAFAISAGLTFTAQLVHLLSYFLDLRLPCKMTYSDFLCCCMSKAQFDRRVARLNANVLYLCTKQNVSCSKLFHAKTIHNIMQLIEDENCDLGRRCGPMDNYHQVRRLEKPLLGKLKPGEDSDSEDNDCLPSEWEAVNVPKNCPESAPGPAVVQTPPQIPVAQQASILVNSAAASLASLWRGFTGR